MGAIDGLVQVDRHFPPLHSETITAENHDVAVRTDPQMVTSGRQNTLGAEFSKTWTCLRMAGWPGRAGALERDTIARMLFRSVQFRAATWRSDVPTLDGPNEAASTR
jgi:hypothetical protein